MRYLNQLEGQLVAASRELSGATAQRPRGRFWVFVRRHSYLSAAFTLVTVAAASGAIADPSLLAPPDLSAPSPLGTASSIPGDLASAFAILRRAPQPADALPAGTSVTDVAGGLGAHYGINPSLSRFVGTVNGTAIWLVPGSAGACMYTPHSGGSCAPNSLVTSQGEFLALVPVAGGPNTLIGIAPDGASVTATNTDGTQGPVSRSGGAYIISGDANLREVTIHEADGRSLTLPSPRPYAPPATGNGPPAQQ
jgi:hypothetical protein